MTQQIFVAVAGNIGAGKSTLTRMLAKTFNWHPFYEANAENPYLADFYADMPRWSFHSQVFFLGKRLEHHHQLIAHPGSVVQDRTVYEDAEIFARNLYEQGRMSQRDYATYRTLYQSIAAFLPPPDLIVYLDSNVETLLQYINRRGRDFEQRIAPAYLEQLNRLYDDWIDHWTICPVLRIANDGLDFQHQSAAYDAIVAQIRQILLPQLA